MYLLFESNGWHEKSSRVVIGVASTKKCAIALLKEKAETYEHNLTKDDLYMLEEFDQTQDYAGGCQFELQHVERNTLF